MKRFVLILAATAIAGCAGVKTKTELLGGKGSQVTSRSGSVCLLAGELPAGIEAIPIGRIKATKGTYGNTDNLMLPMANEARRVGADAVIELQAGIRIKGPLPWRVAAPTGDGQAVKISLPFDCVQAGGQLL